MSIPEGEEHKPGSRIMSRVRGGTLGFENRQLQGSSWEWPQNAVLVSVLTVPTTGVVRPRKVRDGARRGS